MIEILAAGPLTTIQDQGRFGYAHLGVPRSGALDGPALARANRLAGNPPDAAGLEVTLAAIEFVAGRDTVIAVTGAPAAVRIGARNPPGGRPLRVPAGDRVRIGAPWAGARVYVAFAGGVAVEPVLGSRSTDTLSGLGPPPVRPGDVLPLGEPTRNNWSDATADPYTARATPIVLPFTWGPRDDMFTREARAALRWPYRVTPDSNRIGARLAGAPLRRAEAGELPSEGVVLGAIQVTPDGQPLVFLADHPTTGGYPVIGVVGPAGVARVAQARPGDTVVFQADGSGHGPQRRPR